MTEFTSNKLFLDSSIVRSILLGTIAYKRYFQEQFANEDCYISKYVQMEIKRSYLCSLIDFYFVLDMPQIETIGDAFAFWSNRFKASELKAVLQLVSNLVDTRQLSFSNPKDKTKALRSIGSYIKRLESQLRRKFIDIGENATRCTRATISFPSFEDTHSLTDQLKQFQEAFNNVDTCRSQCTVDNFLLEKHRENVEACIQHASQLASPNNANNRGFTKIANSLSKIVDKGATACTCRMCGNIGDAIIAFETPENMRLEHTDHAFDHLCTVTNKPHHKHPSETTLIKQT